MVGRSQVWRSHICSDTNLFCCHKVLNSKLKVIFIGLKKVGNKPVLLVYLLLSSLIKNSNLTQCLHLKENNSLSYFVSKPPIIPSGTKDEPESLVFKGEVTMSKPDQCQPTAIPPNP